MFCLNRTRFINSCRSGCGYWVKHINQSKNDESNCPFLLRLTNLFTVFVFLPARLHSHIMLVSSGSHHQCALPCPRQLIGGLQQHSCTRIYRRIYLNIYAGTTFFRHFFCIHYAPVAKISSVVISIDLAMLSRCLVAFFLASLCAALAFAHEPGDVAEFVSATTLNYSSMSVRVSAFIHLNRYHSPIS